MIKFQIQALHDIIIVKLEASWEGERVHIMHSAGFLQ